MNEEFESKAGEYLETAVDGLEIVLLSVFVPVAFVSTLPFWLIGNVGRLFAKGKRVVE